MTIQPQTPMKLKVELPSIPQPGRLGQLMDALWQSELMLTTILGTATLGGPDIDYVLWCVKPVNGMPSTMFLHMLPSPCYSCICGAKQLSVNRQRRRELEIERQEQGMNRARLGGVPRLKTRIHLHPGKLASRSDKGDIA